MVFESVVIAAKFIYCVKNLTYVVTRKLCDKHKKTKNASCVLSVGDFVLQSLFCAQRLWILNLVFFSNGPRGLTTKTLCFCDVSNSLFISSQNTVTSAREINRLLPAIKL